MIFQIPQEFLRVLLAEHDVSDIQMEALFLALEGQSNALIAKRLGISDVAVRKRLGEVYRKFNIIGSGPGKLSELKQIFVSLYEAQEASNISSTPVNLGEERFQVRQDWGEAPEVTLFYGRTQELATLKQWIVKDKCRLVVILGMMGGIGKSILSVQLAKQIQNEFECVIWRSLHYAPPIQELLTDLLQSLLHQEEINIPQDVSGQISLLIEYLSQHRCLLVLNDLETVLPSSQLARHYPKEYEGYGELLRRLGESNHNSCLVLTSREKSIEIVDFTGDTLPIRELLLSGLRLEDAKNFIFPIKTFAISEQNLLELIELYQGNPLALEIAFKTINKTFKSDFNNFSKRNLSLINNILNEFLQSFENISDLEKNIIYSLAVNHQAVSLADLQASLVFAIDLSELDASLNLLLQQSLIVQEDHAMVAKFTLNNRVKKYITNQFIAKSLNQIGHQQYLEGDFISAKFSLVWSLRFNPDLAAAHYNLGSTYEKLQELERACFHYEMAKHYKTRAADAAINNLARLEIINGNSATAIDLLLFSLERVQDALVKYALHKNLGWAYLQQNQYINAQDYLGKAIELDSSRPDAYYLLAQVQEALEDKKSAFSLWEQGLKNDSRDKKQKKAPWRVPELDVWQSQAYQRLNSVDK
ncbi:NB-ARC domain-containing protein [Nodularia sp. UHCC 0506]|uniref:NB-ARC domain-containing protein n=1 Tax=Nodularia sp. UHCC 0506 TaxID=3110243 RepID=UPI002B1EC192|nr:NB-ARC domain-containing protein [Nodularia sp. UHCC 0506]MEA5517308.1 NB-ARC domain-containing protein [Nodularia sp. UHCC 0506]